jgi:GntR family transcriptional regulator
MTPTKSKTRTIADDLLELIESGQIGPGERLPTESALVKRYGVKRPTVRDAYKILIDSGRVVSMGLSGYFVRTERARYWPLALQGVFADPWSELEGEEAPRTSVTVETRLLDQELQEWFEDPDVDSDEFVCRRELRTLDNAPAQLCVTVFPRHLTEGTPLRRPESLEDDALAILGEQGLHMVRWTDTISVRPASDRETRLLELVDPPLVIELLRRLRFGADEDVLMVERSVWEIEGTRLEVDVRVS